MPPHGISTLQFTIRVGLKRGRSETPGLPSEAHFSPGHPSVVHVPILLLSNLENRRGCVSAASQSLYDRRDALSGLLDFFFCVLVAY